MPIDFKKTEKELYQPKTTPSFIDVPEMTFIAVSGKGNPNASAEYKSAIFPDIRANLSMIIFMSATKVGIFILSSMKQKL